MAFTGTKYDISRTTADCAKLIRADLKAAVKAGELPKGLKLSVRTTSVRAIRIEVKAAPFVFLNPEYVREATLNPHVFQAARLRYSDETIALLARIERIANGYNMDRSEIESDYFHVHYYLTVCFDWQVENTEWKRLADEATAAA